MPLRELMDISREDVVASLILFELMDILFMHGRSFWRMLTGYQEEFSLSA